VRAGRDQEGTRQNSQCSVNRLHACVQSSQARARLALRQSLKLRSP
jgi:hypothetical protein